MREAYTQIAAGLRRLTPAHIQAEATAERFDGRPEDATKGQILAAFKRAAATLGIPPRLRDAMDILMSWSQEQDWDAGGRPIVWPSNRILREELGLSLRQVQYTIRALVEANLVVPVDSPTGRRFGRRHPVTHKIIEAYGFDLSPLAVRYQEFLEVAERAREERQQRSLLRRRLTIARKGIQQIAQTGTDYGLPGRDWAAWARQAVCSVQLLADEASLMSLRAAVASLERQREEGEAILNNVFLSKDSAPSDEVDCTPITTTNQPPPKELCTNVNALQKKHERGVGQGSTPDLPESAFEPKEMPIDQGSVVNISPGIALYLGDGQPSWSNIVAAAYHLRHDLGISQHAWGEACQKMGREYAAACVALIDAKKADVQSPGGYLRGMTLKFQQGELHLARSYYGLSRGTRACH